MNTFSPWSRSVSLVLIALCAIACGGAPPVGETPVDAARITDAVSPTDATPAPRAHCDVSAPTGVSNLVAFQGGVIFGVSDGETSHVERWEGTGCDLTLVRRSSVAGVLVDADASGRAYVMRGGDGVASRIEADDRVTDIVSAGRGIWGFGVSPDSQTMWVTACGPTGIFPMGDTTTVVMGEPATLWQSEPAVLTASDVFWSVGSRTCAPGEPETQACAYALVRSTPTETLAVGTTFVDFGTGYENGRLARCGAGVCGAFESGILMWDDAGRVAFTVSREDLGAEIREAIAHVTGDSRGVYALLTDGSASRVVFVAAHAR